MEAAPGIFAVLYPDDSLISAAKDFIPLYETERVFLGLAMEKEHRKEGWKQVFHTNNEVKYHVERLFLCIGSCNQISVSSDSKSSILGREERVTSSLHPSGFILANLGILFYP